MPSWSCGVCQAQDNWGTKNKCRRCGRPAPQGILRQQEAAVRAAAVLSAPGSRTVFADVHRLARGVGAGLPSGGMRPLAPWSKEAHVLEQLQAENAALQQKVRAAEAAASANAPVLASESGKQQESDDANTSDECPSARAKVTLLEVRIASLGRMPQDEWRDTQMQAAQAELASARDALHATWPHRRQHLRASRRIADTQRQLEKARAAAAEAQKTLEEETARLQSAASDACKRVERLQAELQSQEAELASFGSEENASEPGRPAGSMPSVDDKSAMLEAAASDLGGDPEVDNAVRILLTARANKDAATAAAAARTAAASISAPVAQPAQPHEAPAAKRGMDVEDDDGMVDVLLRGVKLSADDRAIVLENRRLAKKGRTGDADEGLAQPGGDAAMAALLAADKAYCV